MDELADSIRIGARNKNDGFLVLAESCSLHGIACRR